ncbi:MAG: NAD(P)/FAD-dependent oxidoreductase [Gammaproteobacteria bacterium]|nr:NAD(P)/FAD-dependent oxidoreductase [Gammaproteobacteria bacterium]
MKTYDAIVIGAGHNGLTNAAFLAKAGLNVLVVEKNPYIGGATVSRELHPDWIYSNCSYVCSLLRPEIYRALDLARHGLQVTPYAGGATFLQDGGYLGSYWDAEVKYREFARHSKHDANAYLRFKAETARQCRFIRDFMLATPPDPTSFKPRDLKELLHIGQKFVGMDDEVMYDTLRFWTMSVGEYLDEFFESDVIKAHLAGSGIIGTALGPYSPGTAYVMLHHYMGDVDGNLGAWGFARGGMGAVANALHSSLLSLGGELRCNAGVEQILVRDGKAYGVVLDTGEEIKSRVVVSNLDVKRTFLTIMDQNDLDARFVERVRNFHIRGSSGKLNIALDGLPTFPALPANSRLIDGDMHFVDSLERMEKAYDDWKNKTWSKDPYLDMLMPTTNDPTMAPPGKHFMSVFVQYCPPELDSGEWTDAQRDAFGQTVIQQIARYSPDFENLILHAEIRTPKELENEVGLTSGNIFQGELTMDQLLFNRPLPGFAQYRGPVGGMYLCGSSTHPGGGVMAAPGANAAREILSDLKCGNTVPENFGDD